MSTTEKPIVNTNRIEICRNCQGTGSKFKNIQCNVCNGEGRVRVKKEIRTIIETIEFHPFLRTNFID